VSKHAQLDLRVVKGAKLMAVSGPEAAMGTIWSSSPCITSVAAADQASHQWPVLLGSGTVAPGRGLDQAARIFRRLLEHS